MSEFSSQEKKEQLAYLKEVLASVKDSLSKTSQEILLGLITRLGTAVETDTEFSVSKKEIDAMHEMFEEAEQQADTEIAQLHQKQSKLQEEIDSHIGESLALEKELRSDISELEAEKVRHSLQ